MTEQFFSDDCLFAEAMYIISDTVLMLRVNPVSYDFEKFVNSLQRSYNFGSDLLESAIENSQVTRVTLSVITFVFSLYFYSGCFIYQDGGRLDLVDFVS